ncbi:hypothetical protein GEMRC1_011554 [Eukaryota sp. GEM-RC1]
MFKTNLDSSVICQQLYEDRSFTDIVFILEEEHIEVHKVVLAISSEMIRNLYTQGWSDSDLNQLDLSHLSIPIDSFHTVIKWCYGFPVTIDSASIYHVWFTANYLLIRPLEDLCCDFLKEKAVSDPTFLEKPIKDASSNSNSLFFERLQVFSHIKDITKLEAFPVDYDILVWLYETFSKSEQEIFKFFEFVAISCRTGTFTEKECDDVVTLIHDHLDLLSLPDLWALLFKPISSIFPSVVFKYFFPQVCQRYSRDTSAEIPLEITSFFTEHVDLNSSNNVECVQLFLLSLSKPSSQIESHFTRLSQELVVESPTKMYDILRRFSHYFNLIPLETIWTCFLKQFSGAFPNLIFSSLMDFTTERVKINPSIALFHEMIFFIVKHLDSKEDLNSQEVKDVLSLLANVPSIETHDAFPLSFKCAERLVLECHNVYVFCWIFKCIVNSFETKLLDSDCLDKLLMSTRMKTSLQQVSLGLLKTIIVPTIDHLLDSNESPVDSTCLSNFKLNVLFSLLLSSIDGNSSNEQREPLVQEEVDLKQSNRSLSSLKVPKLPTKPSTRENRQMITVNYRYWTDTYTDHPKLSLLKVSFITVPFQNTFNTALLHSWLTDEPNPWEVDQSEVSLGTTTVNWRELSKFCRDHDLIIFYKDCINLYFSKLSKDSAGDFPSLAKVVVDFDTGDENLKYSFFEQTLTLVFNNCTIDQLTSFSRSCSVQFRPDATPLPLFWSCDTPLSDFASTHSNIKSLISMILDRDLKQSIVEVFNYVVKTGYCSEHCFTQLFPLLDSNQKVTFLNLVCPVQLIVSLTFLNRSEASFICSCVNPKHFLDCSFSDPFTSEELALIADNFIVPNLRSLINGLQNNKTGRTVRDILLNPSPYLEGDRINHLYVYIVQHSVPECFDHKSNPFRWDHLDFLRLPSLSVSWKLCFWKHFRTVHHTYSDSEVSRITEHLFGKSFDRCELQTPHFISTLPQKIPKYNRLAYWIPVTELLHIFSSSDYIPPSYTFCHTFNFTSDGQNSDNNIAIMMEIDSGIVLMQSISRNIEYRYGYQIRASFQLQSVGQNIFGRLSDISSIVYVPSQNKIGVKSDSSSSCSFSVANSLPNSSSEFSGVTRVELWRFIKR